MYILELIFKQKKVLRIIYKMDLLFQEKGFDMGLGSNLECRNYLGSLLEGVIAFYHVNL